MAKKTKTAYVCQNCGHDSAKWMGQCPACNKWNTMVEEVIQPAAQKRGNWQQQEARTAAKPKQLKQIAFTKEERRLSGDAELDRVLGGGIMPGSVVLIGGEPGIGKSTLMLQVALMLGKHKVLYVSGEESEQQIKMRAERMPINSENCFVLTETDVSAILQQANQLKPELLVIDSIQTLHAAFLDSAPGSVAQVRECTSELIQFAKTSGVPVMLIGHINKEGNIAGPKVLEHMVDTVLQFEGDRHMSYRILRTAKNRFGPTSELGIYEMRSDGLRQVSNPSEILISQKDEYLSGIAIGATLEGNRPLMIEVQSLVSASAYGTPQRSSTGFDNKRLNMLLAVLEKRGGYRLNLQDVFLNITGGIKVEDPAIDLAVCVSMVSSLEDISVSDKDCFAAEVGLGGEIRAVNRTESRISEAAKLGFERIFVSKYSVKGLDLKKMGIKVMPVSKFSEIVEALFK